MSVVLYIGILGGFCLTSFIVFVLTRESKTKPLPAASDLPEIASGEWVRLRSSWRTASKAIKVSHAIGVFAAFVFAALMFSGSMTKLEMVRASMFPMIVLTSAVFQLLGVQIGTHLLVNDHEIRHRLFWQEISFKKGEVHLHRTGNILVPYMLRMQRGWRRRQARVDAEHVSVLRALGWIDD